MTHTPRNGRAFVGLLVGGTRDIYQHLTSDLYEEYGIELRHHWLTDRDAGLLPHDVEAVLVLTDFVSHGLSRQAIRIAKMMRVRTALIGRKKSAWLNGLNRSGFTHRPSWLRAPEPKAKGAEPVHTVTAVNESTGVITISTDVPKPAPKVDTSARYIPMFNRKSWSEAENNTVVRLFETHTGDAASFVNAVWSETGNYRTPAVLGLKARNLCGLVNIRKGLPASLEAMAKALSRKHKEVIAAERAAVRRGDPLPPMISYTVACDLGSVHRFRDLTLLYDRETATPVYKREDVLAVLRSLRERGVDPKVKRMPLISALEWEARILARLKEWGATAWHKLAQNSKVAKEVRAKLLASKTIECVQVAGRPFYRLPGQPLPTPKQPSTEALRAFNANRKAERIAAAQQPKTNGSAAPAPSSRDTHADSAARADIYRAMRAGELSPVQAVELLRLLNG